MTSVRRFPAALAAAASRAALALGFCVLGLAALPWGLSALGFSVSGQMSGQTASGQPWLQSVLVQSAAAQAPEREIGSQSAGSSPTILIRTNLGNITAELYPGQAPVTVENFLRYVKTGFYSGTVFHRVLEGFMIQGGGYTKESNQKMPLYPPIKLEAKNGLKNLRGTLAMARTRAPDSATCQFFINVVDNPFLDYSETTNPIGYAVFGRVTQGMDVVDRIRAVKVVENPLDLQQDGKPALSLPATPVVIEAIRLAGDGSSGSGADR